MLYEKMTEKNDKAAGINVYIVWVKIIITMILLKHLRGNAIAWSCAL